MLFKRLCREITMEHKESTSVKIMTISAEVLLTEQRFFLTNQAFMMQSIYIRGK